MQDLLKKLLFGNAGGSNGGAPSLNLSFVDGGAFSPRITFSRGTNATLTGSDGLIQYAPHNLLTNSEDFEASGWVKGVGGVGVAPAVTANQAVAPDGTTTADLVVFTNTGTTTSDFSWLYQNFSAQASTTYTYSVWVKASGPSEIGKVIVVAGASGAITLVTLTADWQRVTQTSATAGAGTISVGPRLRGTETTATTASFFIWGAQLNVGALQSYNSTTPKNLLGFTQEPENAAWTKSNSYVQQNLLTWSQDFDNAAWLKSGSSSVTPNVAVAPDGTTTADKYVLSSGATGDLYRSPTVSSGTVTFSIYVKAAEWNFVRLVFGGSYSPSNSTFIRLSDGVVTSGGGFTAQSVGNGWYRITGSSTYVSAADNMVYVTATNSGTAPLANGDGTSGIFIWGAQLVQGADAGQYTQTTSAAAVTRYMNWDGTLTGRKLVEDTANANHGLSVSFTYPATSVYVLSVYAKQDTRIRLELSADTADAQAYCLFNLATGAVIQAGTSVTPTITPAGGGWYRCAIALTVASGAKTIRLRMGNSANDYFYTGDGTSGIYVTDFQLSNSASVDPYVYNPQAAAASAAFYGPRIDYNPVTLASNGLLIEEQRTNLLTYSEQFDNAAWTKVASTVTANSTVAPDANTTADTLVENTANSTHFLYQTIARTAGVATYTYSVFFKPTGASRYVRIMISDATTTNYSAAFVDPASGTVVGSVLNVGFTAGSVTVTPAGNGWYRGVITATTDAASIGITGQVYLATTASVTSYTGDGTSGAFIWGAQLEAGSFATSYIPTVASQVTRNADSASMLGDNFYTWYNPNQGTLYTEGGGLNAAGSARLAGISDGTFSNRIINYLSGATQLAGLISSGGAAQANPTVNVTSAAAVNKLAQGYLVNNVNIAANGTLGTLDTSATIPAVTLMRIGADEVGTGAILNGTIRSIRYYTVRLPDATLQQITS